MKISYIFISLLFVSLLTSSFQFLFNDNTKTQNEANRKFNNIVINNRNFQRSFVTYDIVKVQNVDQKPNMILLGDSITEISRQGLWCETYGSYSDKISEWWNDTIEVINEGNGGSKIMGVVVQERITKYHPKYVLIMYGLNDVAFYGDVEVFRYHYNRVLNETYQQNPNVTVFISTEIWVNESIYGLLGNYPEDLQEVFRNATLKIANERNITFVDLYPIFYRNNNYSGDDGVHQNELGALIIATALNETFYNLIDESPFSYIDEIQVPRKYNINLNLNLNINLPEETSVNKGENLDFIFPIFILLTFSCMIEVGMFLFIERKKQAKSVLGDILVQ